MVVVVGLVFKPHLNNLNLLTRTPVQRRETTAVDNGESSCDAWDDDEAVAASSTAAAVTTGTPAIAFPEDAGVAIVLLVYVRRVRVRVCASFLLSLSLSLPPPALFPGIFLGCNRRQP